MNTPRIMGVSVHRPDRRERALGETEGAVLRVDRGLKSGKLDVVPLDEDALVKLIAQAGQALAILRGVRT